MSPGSTPRTTRAEWYLVRSLAAIGPRFLAGCARFCSLFPAGAALLILSAAFPAPAADPAVGPNPLVLTFNIVAVDARGAPVRDLRDTDLRIWDDGKRMPAAFCR